jgi:hypothetical protein
MAVMNGLQACVLHLVTGNANAVGAQPAHPRPGQQAVLTVSTIAAYCRTSGLCGHVPSEKSVEDLG